MKPESGFDIAAFGSCSIFGNLCCIFHWHCFLLWDFREHSLSGWWQLWSGLWPLRFWKHLGSGIHKIFELPTPVINDPYRDVIFPSLFGLNLFHSSCYGQGHSPPHQVNPSPAWPGFEYFQDGATTASLGNLFQVLTTLTGQNLFLIISTSFWQVGRVSAVLCWATTFLIFVWHEHFCSCVPWNTHISHASSKIPVTLEQPPMPWSLPALLLGSVSLLRGIEGNHNELELAVLVHPKHGAFLHVLYIRGWWEGQACFSWAETPCLRGRKHCSPVILVLELIQSPVGSWGSLTQHCAILTQLCGFWNQSQYFYLVTCCRTW